MTLSAAEQRRTALRARRSLDPAFAEHAARRACRRITRLPVFTRARRIGLYWPMRSEIDPRPLLQALNASQTAFLPRVSGNELRFIAIEAKRFRRRRSGLGVDEPIGGLARAVSVLDLLVLPLAAFDAGANRIGLGGGFYDRTLSDCRQRGHYRGPRLIGLAFETQRVERVDSQPWDVPLDAVATEAALYRHATHAAGLG